MGKPGRRNAAVLFALLSAGAAAGCGGGTDNPIAARIEVATVGVTPASVSVQVGQSATLTAAAYAASGVAIASAAISWTSSDATVASVSPTGLITGVSAGTATISATSNGRTGQALVTVLPASSGGGGGGGGGGANGSVVVNLAAHQQVMTGWEATAQAGQGTASFPLYRDTLFSQAVNDLGINRLRVAVRSGIEDTLDYFPLRNKLGEAQYNCYAYQSVKVPPASFHFSELDSTMEEVVLPLKQKVEARGEHLWINFNYTAFISPTKCAGFSYVHTDPNEYATFALAVFQHVQQKYGVVPDSWEMILEPDNNTYWTSGTLVGRALAATAARLAASGFHPAFVAPSTMAAGNAPTYFDAMEQVPGVAGNIAELSYHRYAVPPTPAVLAAIGQRTVQYGIRSAMLEHIGSDYNDLINDLLIGRVSAWQQFALAFGANDAGGEYYALDTSVPTRPLVILGSRTRYLRQFFRYVRFGAVLVDATATAAGVTPVAFVNPSGKAVVVLRATGAASVTVQGLPPGTYGMHYTTATATDVAASDQTITSGQLVSASIPAAGVLTIFGR